MKKLSIALALIIGLSTAAFANEGDKKNNKHAEKPVATAFKAAIMVYKTSKFALHFKNGGEEKINVTVSDTSGKVIYREQIKKVDHLSKTYQLDQFPKGEYSIKVSSGSTSITKQVEVR